MRTNLFAIILALVPVLSACGAAAPALSGNYKGTVISHGSVTPYQDNNATLVITSDAEKGTIAVVTYQDQTGRYREKCSVTYNSDGTITLKGYAYTLLSGGTFFPDTFTVRIAQDGSVSGGSTDTSGETTKVWFHH